MACTMCWVGICMTVFRLGAACFAIFDRAMNRRAGSGFLVLGALAYMAWGPSFTGSALKGCRPEGAVVRMAGSKWVNEDDPEMSHPSGLYVLPLKPAKKTESYTYTWKKNEKGELEEYAGYVKAGR